jgi:uncharacterized protein
MKASRYNRFFKAENDGHWLAFNGMTSALATLDGEEQYLLVQRILADPNQVDQEDKTVQELWEPLVKGGYLVEDWVDEVEVLKIRNRTARFQNYGLSLTIVPTMKCNLKCAYCYQTHPNEVMSSEVEDALIGMIRDRLRPQEHLGVTWYGGEPLLRLEQILGLTERIDEICKEKESPYAAKIITNGYLLDEQVAQQLQQAHVVSAQITLDGPREIHDQKRPLHNGQGTYDRIMANVEALVGGNGSTEKDDQHLNIAIRVNVDKTNFKDVPRLLDDLTRRGLKTKVGVYVAPIKPYTDVCSSVGGSCFSNQEYTTAEVDLYRLFLSKGFRVAKYPVVHAAYCMADSCKKAFVVGPGGEFYGCWSDVGSTNTIGCLLGEQAGQLTPRLVEYLSWDPFERQECRECDILPVCMGGCPYQGYRAGPNVRRHCDPWKGNLIEMLQLFYTSKTSA